MPTGARRYYSTRTGKFSGREDLDLNWLGKIVVSIFDHFVQLQYFEEYFGRPCVDDDRDGLIGSDPVTYGFIAFRRGGLFPIDRTKTYDEVDCFDLIEFLFDHVSKPVDGWYHSYNQCGTHYETFDRDAGRKEFRDRVNLVLEDYTNGWQLSELGEIQACADPGLDTLLDAPLPPGDERNVNNRVNAAISKFRRRGSTLDDRRDAVRDLVDVLEFLRADAKKVLSNKDEDDLFNIANNFGIRHHNSKQKTNYDPAVWLSWMFYHYLATIHAVIRLVERDN
ncbi:MAG: hypothetical protein JWM80_2539 [Cyanobacteria bacterium RYN_339]|nr:hypothetical protein [Cyanobacteria bacterium RYN_339]